MISLWFCATGILLSTAGFIIFLILMIRYYNRKDEVMPWIFGIGATAMFWCVIATVSVGIQQATKLEEQNREQNLNSDEGRTIVR